MNRYHFRLPKLYFLHIPKTAGTSLKCWLQNFYAEDEVLPIHSLVELAKMTRQEVNQARLIAGHFGWRLFGWFDEPRISVTWLRDPVKRSLSNYNYKRQQFPLLVAEAKRLGREDYIPHYKECQQFSLDELIDQGKYIGFHDNLQVRHMADRLHDDGPLFVDETILNQAIRNLEKMSFVGISEWMNQSIDLCCYQLGFPHHPMQHTLNVTPTVNQRSQNDAALRERLEHINRFDRELYRFAQTRFEQQFSQFWDQLEHHPVQPRICPADFESFDLFLAEVRRQYAVPALQQSLKRSINLKFSNTHAAQLVEEAELNFTDPVFGNNWHPRWPGKTSDTVIRWAGPGNRSTAFFPVAPGQDYEAMFLVENYSAQELVESIKIRVNEHPVPTKIRFAHDNPYQALVWFLVPRTAIKTDNRLTEVAIEVSGEIRPSMINATPTPISFSTAGFQFRASPRDSSLTSTWLSDYCKEQILKQTIDRIRTPSIPLAPFVPADNINASSPASQI